jgi:DNA-binding transcriptional LysR family regulator
MGNPAMRRAVDGFAPVAEQLNLSQSTVSYAIARLRERLGIELSEWKRRKAQLT